MILLILNLNCLDYLIFCDYIIVVVMVSMVDDYFVVHITSALVTNDISGVVVLIDTSLDVFP